MAKKIKRLDYSRWSIALHWLVGVLVLINIGIGYSRSYIPRDIVGYLMGYHKAMGITIWALVWLRLIVRWSLGTPSLPREVPKWQAFLSRVSHWALYILLIMIGLNGYVSMSNGGYGVKWFGIFTIPPIPGEPSKENMEIGLEYHENLALILSLLILVHVTAALYHHYFRKDNVLKRMLGRK